MTAWGGGPHDAASGKPPPTGRTPDERRVIVLIAMFVVAVLVIGLGAFLLGSRQTTETSGGGAGVAGGSAPQADTADPADPARTDVAGVPVTSTEVSTDPDVVDPESIDNSDAARADLELHFANHARGDLEAAYTGLTSSFASDYEEFARFWGNDVASVESPIDGCLVTGERGVCTVRFFITYSDVADPSVRNRCVGQSVELTLQRSDGRFLIDEQRDLGALDCPTP